MNKTEKEHLEESIKFAEDKLSKGLLLPEDASQLYRMIGYYKDKIAREYKEDANVYE